MAKADKHSGNLKSAAARSKSSKSSAASALTLAKEATSPKAVSHAAKVLRDPKSDKATRMAAASALIQWPAVKPRQVTRNVIIDAVRKHKKSGENVL